MVLSQLPSLLFAVFHSGKRVCFWHKSWLYLILHCGECMSDNGILNCSVFGLIGSYWQSRLELVVKNSLLQTSAKVYLPNCLTTVCCSVLLLEVKSSWEDVTFWEKTVFEFLVPSPWQVYDVWRWSGVSLWGIRTDWARGCSFYRGMSYKLTLVWGPGRRKTNQKIKKWEDLRGPVAPLDQTVQSFIIVWWWHSIPEKISTPAPECSAVFLLQILRDHSQ